jgi:hypothetical protein
MCDHDQTSDGGGQFGGDGFPEELRRRNLGDETSDTGGLFMDKAGEMMRTDGGRMSAS